jgi:2-amino-4-hydroxy-6-hydroxymethyldihydropteridine diphosphokinase
LREAVGHLEAALGPLVVAPLYRSAAISPIPQPDFLNTAVVGQTALGAEAVLAIAKQMEIGAGRRSAPRWAPRPLDVDLLLLGQEQRSDPELTLPHPRLAERRFVLAPLADLVPDWRVPPEGRTVARLLADLPDSAPPVEHVRPSSWVTP